jgi:hypothetical protein
VERRYSAFKGPLAVAPMFLITNRRIAALITVICLALLVFCLIERAVRAAIGPGHQNGRPHSRSESQAHRPADLPGPARLRLIPASGGQPALIPQPTLVQARLLDLLAVDPTQPP